MRSPIYRLESDWHVDASPEELEAVFLDSEGLARWWHRVFLDVQLLESGDDSGAGRAAQLTTRGRLPYRIRFHGRIETHERGRGFRIRAEGDFEGTLICRIDEASQGTRVRFVWHVRANKRLFRMFTPLLRPLFVWNHRWAMARGEAGLREEVARRRRSSTDIPRAKAA